MIPYPRWAFTYTHTHKYRRSQGAALGSLEKLEPNLRDRAECKTSTDVLPQTTTEHSPLSGASRAEAPVSVLTLL